MGTPYPQGGGFINNLLGGVAGTLAGTNPLQGSLDQLTQAVNRLSTQMGMGGTLTMSSAANQSGNYTGNLRFPSVNTPGINRQPGIGGGGPGGTGNVTPPAPFGRLGVGLAGGVMLGGAFAGYGQQQMPFNLGLNAYATQSMLGMNNAGMGNFGANFSALANQPGMPITSNSMDYLTMMQRLSFLGGSPRYMSTALGRAGFGAAASFGMTNPTLSGAASASLAQQIYNPMLSMRMRMLGYSVTPRAMGSGMPASIGNIASSMLQGMYGTNRVAASQLSRTFGMGGKGFTDLQFMGLNPSQMAPLIEGYGRLFNAGYSPQAAANLFQQAASNNTTVSRAAQAKLTRAGVTTVSSDIQKIRNNQAQQTQRSVNTAAGFDAALTSATDTLQRFNSLMNLILDKTGMNGPLGAAGGFMGVMSGTNHGNILQGLGGIGLLGLAGRGLFGGGGSLLGGLGGALGKVGGGIGAAAGGLDIGAAASVLGPLALGLGGLYGLSKWDPMTMKQLSQIPQFRMRFGPMGQNIGGGATSAPSPTSAQQSKANSMTSSGVSGAAAKAVSAAESQLGVPYLWGGELPGVGFDCSGLIQWAYKQAGVNLPRTTFAMWDSLKRKSVPTNQAREGDLVFMAGADGTPSNPGHVGLMVSNRQLIEAPTTGQDVKIIGYDPRQWSHAARPTGRANMSISGNAGTGNIGTTGVYGSHGVGMGVGNYGSANEVDLISSTGGFMGGGSGGAFSAGGLGGLQYPNPNALTGNGASPFASGSKAINAEKAYAMALLRARGWGNQFAALNSIINAESGWRWNAQNPSGAYGIPQALPGSKMSAAGKDWRTNPDTQLRWLIDDYIPPRYGTPNQAWAFHQRNGWYGGGGWANNGPGIRVVGDRGPEMQIDTGHGTLTINNAQTMSLLKSISNPQQTPWKNFTNSQYGGQVITPGKGGHISGSINLTFGPNSICITVPTASDAQSSGRAIAQSTVKFLEQELLMSTIAQGQKN